MRVLWLCNYSLKDADISGSGAWLGAMARGLIDSSNLELGIIAHGPVKRFMRCDYRNVKQWLVPFRAASCCEGLPSASFVRDILLAAYEFSPDLVHVWGTENFWGLLSSHELLKCPALLEIQGLMGPVAKAIYGGLSLSERLRCIGIKEVLRRKTMHRDRCNCEQRGLREEKIIRNHRFVNVQSDWVVAHVKAINPDARLFPVDLALRQPFYVASAWQPSGNTNIFCTAAYSAAFKGLHVAIRALLLLKKRIPSVRLRIAGDHQRTGIRQEGYIRWLNRLIWQLGLTDAIDWLGPLNAEQIVQELTNAAAAVIPSFVETYCLALAEAMAVGTPTVVSYVGGIPSLGKDEQSCLFFPPGDEAMCAYQLERVLTDGELAQQLSRESRKVTAVRNDRQRIVQRQLDIYTAVLQASNQHSTCHV